MKDSIPKLSRILVLLPVPVLFISMALIIYNYIKPSATMPQCGVPDPQLRINPDSAFVKGLFIFNENCSRCHYMQDKKLVGPGLSGITERGVSKTRLADYLHNEPLLYASGDTLALAARKRAGKNAMNHYSFTFSATELNALYHYLQTENSIRYDHFPRNH